MRESVIQTDEYRSQGSDKREQTGDPEQVNTILNYLIQNQIYNYDNIKLAVEVFKSKSQKFSYEEINDSYLNIDQDK